VQFKWATAYLPPWSKTVGTPEILAGQGTNTYIFPAGDRLFPSSVAYQSSATTSMNPEAGDRAPRHHPSMGVVKSS